MRRMRVALLAVMLVAIPRLTIAGIPKGLAGFALGAKLQAIHGSIKRGGLRLVEDKQALCVRRIRAQAQGYMLELEFYRGKLYHVGQAYSDLLRSYGKAPEIESQHGIVVYVKRAVRRFGRVSSVLLGRYVASLLPKELKRMLPRTRIRSRRVRAVVRAFFPSREALLSFSRRGRTLSISLKYMGLCRDQRVGSSCYEIASFEVKDDRVQRRAQRCDLRKKRARARQRAKSTPLP